MKIYLFLKGIMFSILGLLLLFFPSEMLNTIIVIFALESVLSLLYNLFFLSQTEDSLLKRQLIGSALFQLIIALIIVFFPQTIHFLLSLTLIVIAILIAIYAINLRFLGQKAKEFWFPYSGTLSFLAVILLLFSIFLAINAFMMIITLIALVGIAVLISGISFIIKAFQIQSIISSPEIIDEE